MRIFLPNQEVNTNSLYFGGGSPKTFRKLNKLKVIGNSSFDLALLLLLLSILLSLLLYINCSLSTGARWKKLVTFNRCTPKPLLWAYCEPNVKQLCVLKKNCTNRSSTARTMLHGIVPNCSSKENELFFKCFWIVALEKLLGNKRMRDL